MRNYRSLAEVLDPSRYAFLDEDTLREAILDEHDLSPQRDVGMIAMGSETTASLREPAREWPVIQRPYKPRHELNEF